VGYVGDVGYGAGLRGPGGHVEDIVKGYSSGGHGQGGAPQIDQTPLL
jgi:hypothetical protein